MTAVVGVAVAAVAVAVEVAVEVNREGGGKLRELVAVAEGVAELALLAATPNTEAPGVKRVGFPIVGGMLNLSGEDVKGDVEGEADAGVVPALFAVCVPSCLAAANDLKLARPPNADEPPKGDEPGTGVVGGREMPKRRGGDAGVPVGRGGGSGAAGVAFCSLCALAS